MKFNAITTTKQKDGEVQFAVAEDAQIDVNVHGLGLQAKFKPNQISLLSDFGTYNRVYKHGTSGHKYTFWWNPYLFFEASREMKINSVYLGDVFHINQNLRTSVGLSGSN